MEETEGQHEALRASFLYNLEYFRSRCLSHDKREAGRRDTERNGKRFPYCLCRAALLRTFRHRDLVFGIGYFADSGGGFAGFGPNRDAHQENIERTRVIMAVRLSRDFRNCHKPGNAERMTMPMMMGNK